MAVSHCMAELEPRECPQIERCPMFPLFGHESALETLKALYCHGEHGSCARWRLFSDGVVPPRNLLPDGRTLEAHRAGSGSGGAVSATIPPERSRPADALNAGWAISFDESPRSIRIARLEGVAPDDEFRRYLARMDAWLREPQRYLVVLDLRDAGLAPRRQQMWQSEWLEANRERLMTEALGTVLVMSNPLVRLIVSTIFLLQRPPGPLLVASDMSAAEDWIEARLRSLGEPVPVELAAALSGLGERARSSRARAQS